MPLLWNIGKVQMKLTQKKKDSIFFSSTLNVNCFLWSLNWLYCLFLLIFTGNELEKLALEVGFTAAKHYEIGGGLMGNLVSTR